MAFAETRTARVVEQGSCGVKITLAGTVYAGDALGYSSGWKLSASATTIQPLLIAGQDGVSGDVITAYPVAVVKVITTVANVATVGQKVALSDAGAYQAAGSGLPDVGFVKSVGPDSLSAILILQPSSPQLAVIRA